MTDRLDITWATGSACVLVDPQLVSYPRSRRVKVDGRMVEEWLAPLEFTVASARPASAAEVERWREQE